MKVTAYITAHLNTDGDVYKSAEAEEYWLNTDEGVRLVQVICNILTTDSLLNIIILKSCKIF